MRLFNEHDGLKLECDSIQLLSKTSQLAIVTLILVSQDTFKITDSVCFSLHKKGIYRILNLMAV